MAFSIRILGSSAATPTTRRNPSSILVNMDYTYFLMDCGEGTQLQIRKYKVKLQRIKHIFISHLHGDHFFGLVGLISTFHLLGRKEELHVYGPKKLKEIIDIQLRASQTELIYPLHFHPTNPGEPAIVFDSDTHFVKSFPLDHRIETTGFIFGEKLKPRKIKKSFLFYEEEISVEDILQVKAGEDFVSKAGKVYKNEDITEDPPVPATFAYCSDTRYHEPLIQSIRSADILYHEATFTDKMRHVAEEKYHSTAKQAALIAKKAEVGKLILGHFSARYRELDELLQEARTVFTNTELAIDGTTYEIR